MTHKATCAWCGKEFQPGRPWGRFCCVGHHHLFYRLMANRGKALVPLLIAAAEARRYGDARNPEMAAFARREADALISGWIVKDRGKGRSCAVVASGKQAEGWRAVDLLARPEVAERGPYPG